MISTLLISTTRLKCLSLAKNRVGVKSMISLGNALSSSMCLLQKLMWVSLPLIPWLYCIWDAPEVDGTGECSPEWGWQLWPHGNALVLGHTRNPIHSIIAALLLKGSLVGVSQRPFRVCHLCESSGLVHTWLHSYSYPLVQWPMTFFLVAQAQCRACTWLAQLYS